jgi:hypothetical protein
MDRRQFAASAIAVVACSAAGPALAAEMPATWDNLVKVKSKRLNYVYLLPGADFRAYTKVMLDPTEVAFRKNWKRDYNSSSRSLSAKITDQDIEKAIAEAGKAATNIFAEAFGKGGYPVVAAPGADVLRLRTGVVNLSVNAPDKMTAGRSRSYSNEAGYATLIVEALDSVSGALLGRAVDNRVAGDYSYMMSRSSVSNRADFAMVAKTWAKNCVTGLDELKRLSPVSAGGGQ